MITVGVSMVLRPINLVGSIILARLLDPSDFGAIALAMVLIGILRLFSRLGMGAALIHSRLDRSKIAFQSFVVTVLLGSLLFLLAVASAGPMAVLLGNPEIAPILRWLFVLILLDNLAVVPYSLLRKELMFGRVARMVVVSQLIQLSVALSLALMGYGLWSLVFSQLIGAFVRTLLVWILCPGWDWLIPKRWDAVVMKGLLGYGLQSSASGLVAYFQSHWDDWLVGSALGTAALGFYSRAFEFTNRTVRQLGHNVISAVFFPSYAKMQDDKERLVRAYLKSVQLILLIMVPVSFGILVLAPQLVAIVLGEKWFPMLPTLQIFALMILTRAISANTSSLFMAVGRPYYNLRAGLVLIVLMVPLALLLLDRGTIGVAIAVVVADIAGVAYNIYQANSILPGTAAKTLTAILLGVLTGVPMLLGVQFLKPLVFQMFGGGHNVIALLSLVSMGGIIYVLTSLITQRVLIGEILRLIVSVFESRFPLVRHIAEWRANA